jgi:hypothetical protein
MESPYSIAVVHGIGKGDTHTMLSEFQKPLCISVCSLVGFFLAMEMCAYKMIVSVRSAQTTFAEKH